MYLTNILYKIRFIINILLSTNTNITDILIYKKVYIIKKLLISIKIKL